MVTAIFWIAAALALAGSIGVVAFREPIRSVLSLVGVMLALSVMFLLLNAEFVFAVQVIVYAGAVMVLFLFVVALLGPIREGPSSRLRFQWALGLLVAATGFGFLFAMLSGLPFLKGTAIDGATFGSVQSIGIGLFTLFLYPFELTSILLLVAAIGAIYLSRGVRPGAHPVDGGAAPAPTPAPTEPERLEEARR